MSEFTTFVSGAASKISQDCGALLCATHFLRCELGVVKTPSLTLEFVASNHIYYGSRKPDDLYVSLLNLSNYKGVPEQGTRPYQRTANGVIKPVPRLLDLGRRHHTSLGHFRGAERVVGIVLAMILFCHRHGGLRSGLYCLWGGSEP